MFVEELIGRVVTHRDRFQAWGLVISILSLFAAVWVRAPTLEISIPLAGGAQASLNAGYIIALGPTIITFSMCWSIGALVAMRRYQLLAIFDTKKLEKHQELSILGPLSAPDLLPEKDKITKLFRKNRAAVFFILPVLAQIAIISTMFNDLHYYSKDSLIDSFKKETVSQLKKRALVNIDTNEIHTLDFFYKEQPESKSHYTLENSNLNKQCGMFYLLEHLNESVLTLNKDRRELRKDLLDINPKCVPADFPRFTLFLNTWINLLMFVLSIVLAIFGNRLYSSKRVSLDLNKSRQERLISEDSEK
ncbi:hypothetical protein [Thalassomonas haliotis]|uniref:Uncharacterized protein n=1 Tax=Thalassomonas haliotis TaxID=485448 RepID=A0ABY7VCE3_9GAMM|nr:hypothetical protein [Thalassomonas haliotis]WDE11040.1 hypothetical protein H3N35_22825 [Thalassomonas haliotis]